MPSKKKKYNARFPAGRIKKIMQSDEEIGKVAQAVPVIIFLYVSLYIPRTLELFVESLLNKTLKITNSRNAKTLSTSHMKQCIMSEQRFDFLRELVKSIPDISVAEELSNIEDETYPDSDTPYDLSMASTSVQAILVNNDGDKMQTKLAGLKNVNTAETLDVNIDQQTFTQINSTSDMLQNYRQRKHGVPHMSISKTSTYSKELHSPLLLQSDSGDGNAITSVQTMMNPVKTLSKCPKLQLLNLEKHQLNCVQNNTKSETAIRETENTTKTFSPIPSPILNYNFNNKPVVKIDYSNISIPTEKLSPAQSLSERNIDPVEATGFNFNTQPVINIDLSNIVSSSSKTEAVATISIGNITSNMNNLVNAPRTANDTNSLNTLPTNDRPANSFFELDEDYDNI